MVSVTPRKDFIMNVVIDTKVIPYLFYLGVGVLALVVLLLVYTGRKDGKVI